MFETICTYPLPSDLFSQAIHPTEPLIAVGLASGHVQTFRLPPLPSPDESTNSGASSSLANGCGTIDTIWKTRRHKGSCRSVVYNSDGSKLFSAGTDGLVKMADTSTGRVESKIMVPGTMRSEQIDGPALLYALTPQTLILGTDSAAMHIYDLRSGSGGLSRRPVSTHHPHDDYMSSITPLPASEASTSGFPKQWVSTGGTTLAVTDVRRGVLVKSDDQEEELLCSCLVSGLPKKGSSVGSKVLVGGDSGIITLWEKGVWDDQDERITVDSARRGGDSLDVIVNVPDSIARHLVAVGLGGGSIRMVKLGMNKVIADIKHDEVEGVVALGFEAEGRMISGGGQIVKVWQEEMNAVGRDDNDEDDAAMDKRTRESDDDSGDMSEEDSSDEEIKQRPKKKKKRKGKSVGKANGISFRNLD